MSSTATTQTPPTLEATQAFAQQVIGYFTGHAVTRMIHLRDRKV